MTIDNDDIKILVVDDDEDNRWILNHPLKRTLKFKNICEADDGTTGLKCLEDNKDVNVIFLDRMMPTMNGLKMYEEIRKHPEYEDIVVIFQTGKTALEELNDVINLGATYLMKKPYNPEDIGAFLIPVATKIRRLRYFEEQLSTISSLDENTNFKVKTFDEAKPIAAKVAKGLPDPVHAAEAIYGLIENAIEHGHLRINGSKASLLKESFTGDKPGENFYYEEIERRLAESENVNKEVSVTYEKKEGCITVKVEDQGRGFDHTGYEVVDRLRLLEPHGRGIAYANKIFDNIEYFENGSIVVCTMKLN